jgi:tetratricopeptide (TPR) repeat protein
MKKHSIYFTVLFITISILIAGCGDNFLRVNSREHVAVKDRDSTYTPEDFVTGIYGNFTDFAYAFSWLGITSIISDNARKGSDPNDSGTDKDLLDNFAFSSADVSVAQMWQKWYKTIGRATYAIDYTKSYEDTTQVANADRLVGEAKFLRALDYFFLVRYFGDIPIQSKSTDKRAPKDSVYAYIINDLKSAEQSLPKKSEYPPEDLGRATKGAARTLLAKVYLQRKNWQQALDYAQKVIDSGEYSLFPDYSKIFRESDENGVGSIFEIQARGEAPAHGIQQYTTTQSPRGTGGWGWGFNVPSQSLVNAFEAAGDSIREHATIMFAGDTLYDGQVVSPNAANPRYNYKAYSSANKGAPQGDHNMRMLRYAGVLLVKAEAAEELGDIATSEKALNKVRARVDLPPITTQDQDKLRNDIYREHRLEFAMEHKRWFFLLRTGRAKQAIMATDNAAAKANFDKHFTLFPIPISQIRNTPDMRQNPGY